MWRVAVFLVAALCALPEAAVNRCGTPAGRVVYTDATCESIGAKLDRAVSKEISVVPQQQQPRTPKGAPAAPAADTRRPAAAFQKAANAPVMRVCSDRLDARKEVTRVQAKAATRPAAETAQTVGEAP